MSRYDAIVAGAGPAGVAAALTLARGGAEVLVLDRARFPRDKCCGDGLTAGALRGLESLGLDPSAVPSWTVVTDVCLRSPSGREVAMGLPGDGVHAAVAPRLELDAALVDLLRGAAGVTLAEGVPLEGLGLEHDRVRVRAGSEDHEAPFVVGADGAWSPTRRFLGGGGDRGGYRGEWHAMRQYWSGVEGDAAHRLWVWFEPDLLPAYAWSFPLGGGRVNLGLGIVRRPGWRAGGMAPLWSGLVRRPHIREVLGRAEPEGTVKAWPIPASPDPSRLAGAGGRVLFIGDAARVADPMTGEGIGQALTSGRAVARAILAGPAGRPAAVAAAYRRSVEPLHLDNRWAGLLSGVMAHPLGARGALRVAGLSAWTRANFARWMFEDYPRAVLATPGRWGHRALHPPGAYA
ncbi:MAG: NAD(P)/FAD-dependent oxidoreductase [Acidimicrobiales bacterium]